MSPVNEPDESGLRESLEQLEFLGGFSGVEVEVPDSVPDLLATFLLHAVHVRDRPQTRSHAIRSHTQSLRLQR